MEKFIGEYTENLKRKEDSILSLVFRLFVFEYLNLTKVKIKTNA